MARGDVEILPEADRLAEFAHPRETFDLVGQAEAEAAVLDAWGSGKMHHAWLLSGPKGVGKATLAYRMARFLLTYAEPKADHVPEDLAVSAEAPAARLVTALSHPDLFVLRRPWDPKTKKHKASIPVDEVRRIGGFFSTHSSMGGWRVVIVDSADEMNPAAANAILKMLEEPPSQTILMLISHSPGRLLPTIRSRCRKLTLNPLGADDIAHVLAANEQEVAPKDTAAVALLAEGSAGEALSLAAGGGLELYREIESVLGSLPNPDGTALHTLADKVAKRGADDTWRAAQDMITRWCGRVARMLATGETAPDIITGEGSRVLDLSAGTSPAAWAEAWSQLGQDFARGDGLNMDRKQVFMNAVLRLQALAAKRAA